MVAHWKAVYEQINLQRTQPLCLQRRDSTAVCMVARWKAASERTKLQRMGQRPLRALSKMQRANRLKAQTFRSNRETVSRCSAQLRPIQRDAIFHRDCNRVFTA